MGLAWREAALAIAWAALFVCHRVKLSSKKSFKRYLQVETIEPTKKWMSLLCIGYVNEDEDGFQLS